MGLFKKSVKIDELSLIGVGACPIPTSNPNSALAVAYAYVTDGETTINCILMPLPDEDKKYGRNDILRAVAQAENAKTATYGVEASGGKNIYLCRENGGAIRDVVERDTFRNRFTQGFAEAVPSNLKFSILGELPQNLRMGEKFTPSVTPVKSAYAKDTAEYAVLNAYNACLLAIAFDGEEFKIETAEHAPVKFEVRADSNVYWDEDVLIINPQVDSDGAVTCYETEKFNYIDGADVSVCAYRLTYSNRTKRYNVVRI